MNVIIKDENEKPKKEKNSKPEKPKKAKKPKKEKKVRSPKEFTALLLGCFSLVLAILAVAALIFLSTTVGIVLGGCAILAGFISLFVGKGGTLPAVVGLVAGFLTILSAIVSIQLQ